MMTVISRTDLEPGAEPRWDAAFRRRAAEARSQPGFVGVQLLVPVDSPGSRVIVGTWRSRADWEKWHNAEAFRETRQELDQAGHAGREEAWYEVVETIQVGAD